MKMRFIPTLTLLLFLGGCSSADKGLTMPTQNSYKVEADDTKERIIEKAAHVVPTANQLAALQDEYIAFIHFGPNTFTRMEWGNGMEDPKIFDLKELDTDQWCEAMKAAGMTKVLFTAKHHDGFVLWQSRYTDHGIMSTGFRDGKGDILKDLSKSCEKYGLKLGVYLSPADLYHIENAEGLYGNLSKYSKRQIPRAVEGRPFANKTTFEFEVDDYNEYFLNQLFELLTEYGEIHEVWFDGAHPKRKGGQRYNYPAWKELIHTLAPKAVIFGREDIRWCGNEAGDTRDTEWNVIPYTENPDTTSTFPDMTDVLLGGRDQLYKATYLHYQPAETNTSIREGWFYRDDTHQNVRSADDVYDMYERSVGGNSVFLLNIPPNRDGKFSDRDVESLREAGKRIKETYGTNLLSGAKGPKAMLDNKYETFALIENNEIVITTPQPITLNRLVIQEAVATHSERVEAHSLEAWVDNQWVEVARATNVGYKRILRFADVTTNKLRIKVLGSRMTPAICNITAHYYQSRAPQLTYNRLAGNKVSIEPAKHDFGWKPHGKDIVESLNIGFKIFYTIDGSEPSAKSKEYTAPFEMNEGILKAVAILNDTPGAVMTEQVGMSKDAWKLAGATASVNNRTADKAFDYNNNTFFQTKDNQPTPYIAIDLGKVASLNGFAYTPVKSATGSMMAKGVIKVSQNGRNWQSVESFDFGNLINDPSKRYHRFNKAVKGRYVRIETSEIANNGKSIAIAEIDLF